MAVQRARVEKCGRGGAEAATFIEIIKTNGPLFTLSFLALEKTHRDAHPEKLWRLNAAMFVAGFVNDEVAIVECLNSEEVEVEVGGGVESFGNFIDIVEIE